MFGGKNIQALLQCFHLAFDRCLAGGPKRRDGVGNRVVETSVQGAKFVRGDGYIPFDGQRRNTLAHIPVVVYLSRCRTPELQVDSLVDPIVEFAVHRIGMLFPQFLSLLAQLPTFHAKQIFAIRFSAIV